MGRKSLYTTNTQIKAALHRLWLRSRERGSAIKRDEYTCQVCKGKQSKRKGHEFSVQVHHNEGVCNWQEIYDSIRKNLLCDPSNMETLCKDCHLEVHKKNAPAD